MSGSTVPASGIARRREQLVRIVTERGHVVIADLAVALRVSEMTVRRDVALLADDGRVVSYYGGVRPVDSAGSPRPMAVRFAEESRAKQNIAIRAAQYVADDAVIALDAGSTVALLAEQLVGRSGLRVITASVPVITAFADADGVDLVALGGTLRRDTQSFIGPSVSAAARELQASTYFLAAAGLSPRGVFDITDLDAVVKRELVQVSTRVIAVADSTKFAKRAMSRICGWDAIDVLITDDRIDQPSLDMLRDLDIDVDLVAAS